MNPYTFQATSQPKNHAKAILINSFPLALIFTLIYVPLLVAFVFKAFKNPTYVLWVTAFFCQGSTVRGCSLNPEGLCISIIQCALCHSQCGHY